MKKIILIISLLSFVPHIVFSQYDKFRIKNFTLEDGLSQVSVNALLKDGYGFVWIATDDGLNRFDGTKFKHYKYSELDSMSISGNSIGELLLDKNENLWIGTNGNGLNYFDRKNNVFRRIALNNSATKNESITALEIDESENIWIGSLASGLFRLKPSQNGTYIQNNYFFNKPITALLIDAHKIMWVGDWEGNVYKTNPLDEKSLKNEVEFRVEGQVRAFYRTEKYLLIGCDEGLYLYNLQSEKVHFFDFGKSLAQSTKYVNSFLKTNVSQVWVGTGSGLFLFDWVKKSIVEKVVYSDEGSRSLSNNTVLSLLRLNKTQILAGTATYLNLIDFMEPAFQNISKDKRGKHLLNDNVVFSIFKEGKDLWIGTSDGGLNLMRGDKVFYFNSNQTDSTSISGTVVRDIVKDDKTQRLWLATTRGLSMIDLKTFDPDHPEFRIFNHNPNNPNSINMDFLKDLALDQNNNLWGATYGQGIFRLEMKDDKKVEITRYKKDINDSNSLSNNLAHCIRVDRQNNILIGSQGGLTKINFAGPNYENPIFTSFHKGVATPKSLSDNSVYDILIDGENRLWAGTRHGLNLYLGNNEFESWTEQEQFPNAVIYSIQDDEQGNLWLGTNDGIVKFDLENKDFKHYSMEDGIQSREFDIHAKFRDSAGTIYLGGIGGLTFFNPENLENIDDPQPLYFSELRMNNRQRNQIDVSKSVLNSSILNTEELVFRHDQFPFYLKFSSIDFRWNKNVQYAYKLLPSNMEWNLLEDQEIQFLNLPAGDYTLLVNGFSRGKEWNQQPLEIALSILPPWWRTWLAYGIYFILAVLLAIRFYRFQLSRKLAVAESIRLTEIDQLKNSLYTNITHEFRTPLTVILGMTDTLQSKAEIQRWKDAEIPLDMIHRNGKGLLKLVNEMLDLAKLESGHMELDLIRADVIPFIKYLCESYHSLAQGKNIELNVDTETEKLTMDFDAAKLTVILSNLITNAIKFTPEGGRVSVYIDQISQAGQENLSLKITDTGKGLSKEEIPHVFDRFYQADHSTTRQTEGTGIGLALTKELVELLDGSISVKSEPGKGSEFHVRIPITLNALNASAVPETFSIDPPAIPIPEYAIEGKDQRVDLPLVLIIEDNLDVANYLKIALENKYHCLHATNGILGLEMAYENIPDIIICDIMMPGMDGYTVCSTLKADERSDHIPVIMLTAKVSTGDRLEGLSRGADAYLAKPFEKEELLIRLDKLLEIRQKLQQKYSHPLFGSENKMIPPATKIESFLHKVEEAILEHLEEEDFSVDQLADAIFLSRSQVHRKIKALTGHSTSIYIRLIRLQKAKHLLASEDLTISEVAYRVGFKSPVYFSQIFKKTYGESPSVSRQ